MIQLQIGKNGLTKEFIESLKNAFKNTDNARVSVLKSATRNRDELEKWAQSIIADLGKNYTSKIIGWTIVLTKWRKARV